MIKIFTFHVKLIILFVRFLLFSVAFRGELIIVFLCFT